LNHPAGIATVTSDEKGSQTVFYSKHLLGRIERIAIALEIDTLDLFTPDKKKPETIKAYQKSTIKQVKSLVSQFLDERLKELEKKP
jgi:hypothetical protein